MIIFTHNEDKEIVNFVDDSANIFSVCIVYCKYKSD